MKIFSFTYGCPIFLASFVGKTICIPLNYFCIFVKNQLDVFVLICFWALCCVPFICMSVPLPVPYSNDYYG